MDRNFSILLDEERFREDIKKQLFEINNQLTDLRNILAKTNARQLASQEQLQKNMTLPESEFPLSSEEAMRDVDAKIRNCPNNYVHDEDHSSSSSSRYTPPNHYIAATMLNCENNIIFVHGFIDFTADF
ncbi:hypothetical protein ACLKA6_001082 [Drosophila palustris]